MDRILPSNYVPIIIFSFLIVQCLLDFNELSPAVPVATFFQEMNDRKNLSSEFLELSLPNLACYLSCIPFEQVFFPWNRFHKIFSYFFREIKVSILASVAYWHPNKQVEVLYCEKSQLQNQYYCQYYFRFRMNFVQ